MTSRSSSNVGTVPATGSIGRLVGGGLLVAAALVELISVAVSADVSTGTGPSQTLDGIAGNPSGLVAEGYLGVLLPALLVPGLVAALGLVSAKGRNLVYVGVCLALIGGLGHAVIAMAPLALVPMVAPGANRAEMVALVRPIEALVFPIALPLLIVIFIGLLLFVIGLWRARLIPTWILVMYGIYFLLASPLGEPLSGMPLKLVRVLPFAIAFASIGVLIMREKGSIKQ